MHLFKENFILLVHNLLRVKILTKSEHLLRNFAFEKYKDT